jgi:hypothetical protein
MNLIVATYHALAKSPFNPTKTTASAVNNDGKPHDKHERTNEAPPDAGGGCCRE